jgi:Zn ribbon nucleic-acid-binding protein
MNVKTRSAGDILDATCTRCRVLTNHTIVALVEGRVARVKCNTCGSEHNYHAPKEEKSHAARRVTAPRDRTSSLTSTKKEILPRYREQWETALAGKDSEATKEYDMAGKFMKDDLVRHPVFGIGIVTMAAGTKMDVLFADGPKLLRCGK